MKNIMIPSACILICILSSNVFSGIEKIDDGLYVGKKDDLYVGFERVITENSSFWQKYLRIQYTKTRKKLDELNNTECHTKEEKKQYKLQQQQLNNTIEAINPFIDFLEYQNIENLWITYATSKKITDLAEKISLENDIEMMVSVATHKDVPFSTHMGIFRPLNDLKSTHKNISMHLHSFATQATQIVCNNAKDYMITQPLPIMRKIMEKNLSQYALWTNKEKPTVSLNDDKSIMTIINQSNEKVTFKTPQFFNPHWLNNEYMPMVIIDLKALANFTKFD